MVNYSLNAYCPREGFRVSISGDRGRIEYEEEHASHIITDGEEVKLDDGHVRRLRVQPLFSEVYSVDIPATLGGHGGADPLIQEQMFNDFAPVDELKRNAGHEQGAASLLIGVAANQSMSSGLSIKIDELLPLRPAAEKLSELI